jgi:glycyl-tRNA synthetase beta chain
MGVAVAELSTIQTPKGEYYSFSRHVPGRKTADVLADALPPLFGRIYFPKTMYWTGNGGLRFIRPVRWVVCLLGDAVVPFQIAGVTSGNVTRGHRLLGSPSVAVTIPDYEHKLRENGVILSAAARRKRIEIGVAALVRSSNAVQPDPLLLNTLVYLTEFPTPIRGVFEAGYLALPSEILTTVMRHHQRYFSIMDSAGRLAPEFIAVMNTDADPEGLVRQGNERVLRARFNDARFFWDVDQRRPLGDRLEDLKNVTFQAKLGSYYEKTQRNVALAREIAQKTGAPVASCERAALLAKCDLTTEMVKEFTELQGVVGGLYANAAGEPAEIWRAVYEHYAPAGMEDPIPSTITGQVVALADKIDTLRGCFDIGLIPTGSRDPFALRRAAQGVVKILVEGGLSIPLSDVAAGNAQLHEFLLDRARYYFKDVRGFAYDEVNAVFSAGAEDLTGVERRLEAIKAVRPTENFEPLAASFKRIQNILVQADFREGGAVDEALLEPGPEAELHGQFVRLREAVDAHRSSGDYRGALEAIASIRPGVDTFFDKVLVNAQDERVRRNRLLLLNRLLSEFSTIADFSEIVITH